MSLVSGKEDRFQLNESCVGAPPVLGIVGVEISDATAGVLGLYRVPMVSLLLESPFAISNLMCSILVIYLQI